MGLIEMDLRRITTPIGCVWVDLDAPAERVGAPPAKNDPSPDELAERIAAVQSGWSERERRRRAGESAETVELMHWTTPPRRGGTSLG